MTKLFDVDSKNQIVVDGKVYDESIIELYDNYDKSFADWCSFYYRKRNDNSMMRIPTVFATPDRAFAQYEEFLNNKLVSNNSLGNVNKGKFNINTLPLPFISINRGDYVIDLQRYQFARIRKRFLSSDRRKWVGGEYPHPVTIPYTIEIWSKTISIGDVVKLQVLRKFYRSRFSFMPVYHPLPVGTLNIAIALPVFTDNTGLEFSTTEERVIRQTYKFEVNGWLTYPLSITPSVRSVNIELAVENADGTEDVAGVVSFEATDEDLATNFADEISDTTNGGMLR